MSINTTDHILRRIQHYAIAAIILTAVIIALVSIYPLYTKLEFVEKKVIVFARDASILMVDEYLIHLKEISRDIADQNKRMLEHHTTDHAEMLKALNKMLHMAMKDNKQLIGIT